MSFVRIRELRRSADVRHIPIFFPVALSPTPPESAEAGQSQETEPSQVVASVVVIAILRRRSGGSLVGVGSVTRLSKAQRGT